EDGIRDFHVTGVQTCALPILVYKDVYWQWTYAALDRPDEVPTAAAQAAAIEAAWTRFGPELRSVKLPEPGVPAYHLYLQDGEARSEERRVGRYGRVPWSSGTT